MSNLHQQNEEQSREVEIPITLQTDRGNQISLLVKSNQNSKAATMNSFNLSQAQYSTGEPKLSIQQQHIDFSPLAQIEPADPDNQDFESFQFQR